LEAALLLTADYLVEFAPQLFLLNEAHAGLKQRCYGARAPIWAIPFSCSPTFADVNFRQELGVSIASD
jgi:hypothetical protein